MQIDSPEQIQESLNHLKGSYQYTFQEKFLIRGISSLLCGAISIAIIFMVFSSNDPDKYSASIFAILFFMFFYSLSHWYSSIQLFVTDQRVIRQSKILLFITNNYTLQIYDISKVYTEHFKSELLVFKKKNSKTEIKIPLFKELKNKLH